MKTKALLLTTLISIFCQLIMAQKPAIKNWALEKPVRLVQTNLREIDLEDFDVLRYANDVEAMGANAVLINIGGIVANYPSELPYQFVNPRLKSDIIGEVIEILHKRDIKVIGRFDFSKLNETIAEKHPEWLYLSTGDYNVNYNGQVHTCMNGEYQQEKNFKILEEVIDRYPVDGIFFNMTGYQITDYSHNYHGICQSDACRARFKDWSGGLNLPIKEDITDPVFLKFQEFKDYTVSELYERINAFIKAKKPEMVICTYVDKGVDLRRHESHSHVNVTHTWEFQSTDHVKQILGSYKNKQISNAAVHFMSFAFRHASVSPSLTERRLAQNIIHGGGLDFYCIGRLDNQEDRASLEKVKQVFQFHKKNESYFSNIKSTTRIVLITTTNRYQHVSKHGFVRFLTENHMPFDMILQNQLDGNTLPRPIEDYELVILPDISDLSENSVKRLDTYVKNGGKLLSTGFTSTNDEIGNPLNKISLESLGVEENYDVFKKTMGTYLKLSEADKMNFNSTDFSAIELMYLYEDFLLCQPKEGAKSFLKFVKPAMFGPPEKCYYTDVSEFPGMIYNTYGKGQSVYFPWQIGKHYEKRSHHGHAALLLGAINDLLRVEKNIIVDTSPLVEMSYMESQSGDFGWFGLLNHSGQLNTASHPPIPISDIKIKFKTNKKIKSVKLLNQNLGIEFDQKDNWVSLVVPQIHAFEIVALEY